MEMFLIMGGALLLMWFLMVRPAQRRMREQMETQSSVGEGTRVMLTSGFYATVRHAGDKQVVVELAPDVEVTVARAAIAHVVGPDEEEFEFVDAAPAGAAEPEGLAVLPANDAPTPDLAAGGAHAAHPAPGTAAAEPQGWTPQQQEAAFGRPDAPLTEGAAQDDSKDR